MKKRTHIILIAIVVVVAGYLAAINTWSVLNNDNIVVKQSTSNDIITVYGVGRISLVPDVAYITMGYENINNDPKIAQDRNLEKMASIIEMLIDEGISEEDIQTVSFNVNQEYDHVNGHRKILGYRVTNLIRVTINDTEEAGHYIKLAYDEGSNVFQRIEFDIIDREQAYLDALDTAIQRAEQKANEIASKTNRRVGEVLEIMEQGSSSSTYYSQYSNVMSSSGYEALSYARERHGSISEGQVEIEANVNIVFRLE